MYVDWKSSALVINEQAISFAPGKIKIDGSFGAYSYHWDRPSDPSPATATAGGLIATAELPSDIEFVPPHTYVAKKLMGVTYQEVSHLHDSMLSRKKIRAAARESYEAVKLARFTRETSPLAFKSYPTVLIGRSELKVYQHAFYVSELMQALDPAGNLNGETRGDHFFVIQNSLNGSIPVGYETVGVR